jgi:hypothetical protein
MAKGIANKTYNKTALTTSIEIYLESRITKLSATRWMTAEGVEITKLGSNDFLVEFATNFIRFSNLAEVKEAVVAVQVGA